MPGHAAVMRVIYIAVGHAWVARAAGGDEAAPVAARRHLASRDRELLALVTALGVIMSATNSAAIFKIILVLHLTLIPFVVHVAHVEEQRLAVRIFGDAKHGVRRLALVAPLESPADRHRANRVRQRRIHRPARHVELMRPLVVQIAVAGLPKPVPVVMHIVRVVRVDHRRPAPQVPVQVRRRGGRTLEPDAGSRLAAVAIRNHQLAELAGVDHLVQARDTRAAALLRAVLDHDAVLALRLNRHSTLVHVVAHRFLDVNMLAGLGAPDRHQRVPMVRRRDRDRIHRLVGQGLANIRDPLGVELALGLPPDLVHLAGDRLLVRVDEVGDLHIFLAQPAVDVAAAAPVQAGHRDAEPVVRTMYADLPLRAANQCRRAGGQ